MNSYRYLLGSVAALCAAVSVEACTTWVIHPTATKSGRMTVNKSRDLHKSPVRLCIRRSPRGWRG